MAGKIAEILNFKTLFALALGVFLAGCGSERPRPLYYWDGSYSSSLYEYMSETGDVNEQIGALENSIQNAYENAQKVPPGLYAHLGLLYANNGDNVKANINFDKEIENFPESKEYITFLRMHGAKKAAKKGSKHEK